MTPLIVEVALDPAVADLDRTLHYRLPDSLQAAPGQRVRVPLGSRRIEGLIVGTGEPGQLPAGVELKNVLEVLDPEPVLGPGLLDLAVWLAERFAASLAEAAWMMLPPGIRRNVKPKLEQRWELAAGRDEAAAALAGLERRAPKQAFALQRLLDAAGPFAAAADNLAAPLRALADKGLARPVWVESWRDPNPVANYQPGEPQTPTAEQAAALAEIARRLDRPQPGTLLLHGVTGSGKTEIYLQSIARVLASGRQAIVLVPEIALTPQMIERFKSRFGERVAVLHSRLSDGERYDQWRAIRSGRVAIAVGARSAIFAPFDHIGLIVVDEEHETSYKQQESPRYHARTVAAQRARQAGALLLLGSATPSLETFWTAKLSADIGLITLSQRIDNRPLPPVELVDLRAELAAGNRSIFSHSLQQSLHETLNRGEQAILFLNRRGFSTFVLCRSCGYTAKCPNCDVSLTYHVGATSLTCHYCGHEEAPPRRCPACDSEKIRFFGAGTEKVQAELESLFPNVRALRLDVDTTRQKGSHERILGAFGQGKAQVLVGTQMVAKGLDFPGVTLVGVIAADTALNFPDFRAAERTFQLLTQVAGRSGRGQSRGRVVVQTYNPDHYAVIAAASHDYLRFYEQEMVIRREVGYPPLTRLINLLVTGPDEAAVEARARQAGLAMAQVFPFELIWGPNPAPLSKLKGNFRWQVAVRGDDGRALRQGVRQALQLLPRRSGDLARLVVDVDPVSML
ncbi:MAG: primosomal protein N' [Symbiobacteriia bacterium]